MLNLLDGGVNQMITHLEEVTKKDRVVVNIKDVFQKMTLDVIARSFILHKIKKPNNQNLTHDKNNQKKIDKTLHKKITI